MSQDELDPTERLLVKLSRVRPAPVLDASDLDGLDRDALLELAARLGNFNLIGRRLLAVPGALAGPLRARVERNLAYSDLRERAAFADLRVLARELAEAGEPLLLLKGGAYTRFIYPEPGLRRFSDLDVLLRPRAMPRARAALARLGYTVAVEIEGSVDLRRPIGGPSLGVMIELTTDLVHTQEYPYYRADLALSEERLLSRGESRDLDGVPIRVLGAADELLYSVLHFLFHHDLVGLKYHSDLNALFTDPVRPLDPAAAAAVAEEARAGYAVGLALLVHEATLGPGAVPAGLLERLAPKGLRRAALRAVLPPLARVPLVESRAAGHPVKVLIAPGLLAPVGLGLRWFFPGKRFLMSFYRLEQETWTSAYHLRYPAEILRKGLRRAVFGSRAA